MNWKELISNKRLGQEAVYHSTNAVYADVQKLQILSLHSDIVRNVQATGNIARIIYSHMNM